MQCNIDAKGKAVRLGVGLILDLAGTTLIILAAMGAIDGQWPWYAGVALMLVGAIAIFEGAAGWCAIRAMGIRTRI